MSVLISTIDKMFLISYSNVSGNFGKNSSALSHVRKLLFSQDFDLRVFCCICLRCNDAVGDADADGDDAINVDISCGSTFNDDKSIQLLKEENINLNTYTFKHTKQLSQQLKKIKKKSPQQKQNKRKKKRKIKKG